MARSRLQGYTARVARFRRLRKIGIDTARLLRTGLKAMTYGASIMGVADGMLRSQRQVASAIAAPGAGTGGQNMDIALIFADGGPKGKADPAFDAHMMPIGEWALASWENWATEVAMESIVKAALAMVAKGKNRWASVYGPGAALVMTCIRIEWQVVSARHLVTHEGEMLDLKLDPRQWFF